MAAATAKIGFAIIAVVNNLKPVAAIPKIGPNAEIPAINLPNIINKGPAAAKIPVNVKIMFCVCGDKFLKLSVKPFMKFDNFVTALTTAGKIFCPISINAFFIVAIP